jgi:Protein of unknown function (DUF3306)
MTNSRDDETFFSRWSRQKRAQPPAAARKPATPQPTDTADDTDAIDLTQLPNIEDLTAESDITAFLRKGVPEALKRLALRRMWALDPAIRDFVEVAENQWDFNASGGIYGLYQDIPAGSDVSLWLAQATPSVAHKDPEPASDTSGAPADETAVAAAQQDDRPVTDQPGGAPPVETASASTAKTAQADVTQMTDVAQKTQAPDAPRPHDSHPSRRRHGGALPS